MSIQKIEIKRKNAEIFTVEADSKVVNELRAVFNACSGNFFSGKYNMNDFAEFLTNDDIVGFFEQAKKFKSWGGLIKRVGEHPNLVYLLLYATFIFIEDGKRGLDLPLILAREASWVYKDIYKDFNDPAYLVTDYAYDRWIKGADFLGRPKKTPTGNASELFLSSDKQLIKVLDDVAGCENYKDQSEIFSKTLGFPVGYFDKVDTIYKLLISHSELGESLKSGRELAERFKKFIPKGTEVGANDCWIAGGRTEGGMPEIILENLPNTPDFVKKVTALKKIDGLFKMPLKDVTNSHGFSASL